MNKLVQLGALGLMATAAGCSSDSGMTTSPPTTMNKPPVAAPGDGSTPGDVTADEVRQESKEALEAAGKYADKAKDEFVAKLKTQMDSLDKKIAEMEDKSQDKSAEARAKWDQRVEKLKERRVELDAQLEKVKASSGDAWRELRDGTQRAWSEFAGAVRSAAEEFDKDTPPETPDSQP
jgi:hypothetical protein